MSQSLVMLPKEEYLFAGVQQRALSAKASCAVLFLLRDLHRASVNSFLCVEAMQ